MVRVRRERVPFIAGNWKMNLDRRSATTLAAALAEARGTFPECEVGLFPPFTMLAEVAAEAEGSGLIVGAQDCHAEKAGAYTGCVSAPMVKDAGATHVILGHSERRRDCGEDEALLARKLRATLDAGLAPILCVGETLAQRQAGETLDVVRKQVEGALGGFDAKELARLVLAYEPVWAIGTGHTATPAQAVEVHRDIRRVVEQRFGAPFARALRIQYGGSVNPGNAASLLREQEIDGALVGGASLEFDSFVAIVRAAA
jgi:triosephosphate isomerase